MTTEKKDDTGTSLRKRRMQRGLSLEAAHQNTRIPKRLLEALESNDDKAFPAKVYLRGFLKTYCDYLELDFEPLWTQYETPAPQPPGAPQAKTSARRRGGKPGADRPFMLPLTESTLLPVLLLGGIIAFGALTWALKKDPAPTAPAPVPRPAAAAPRAPGELTLTATRDVIVRVSVDGRQRFEGRVPAGRSQRWQAKEDIALRTGDPDALRVELDGRRIGLAALPTDAGGWRRIALTPSHDAPQ